MFFAASQSPISQLSRVPNIQSSRYSCLGPLRQRDVDEPVIAARKDLGELGLRHVRIVVAPDVGDDPLHPFRRWRRDRLEQHGRGIGRRSHLRTEEIRHAERIHQQPAGVCHRHADQPAA